MWGAPSWESSSAPEGLADPASFVDELSGMPEESVRKIMGGNLASLMNLPDKVLR